MNRDNLEDLLGAIINMCYIESKVISIWEKSKCYVGIVARSIVRCIINSEVICVSSVSARGLEALGCNCGCIGDIQVPTINFVSMAIQRNWT